MRFGIYGIHNKDSKVIIYIKMNVGNLLNIWKLGWEIYSTLWQCRQKQILYCENENRKLIVYVYENGDRKLVVYMKLRVRNW